MRYAISTALVLILMSGSLVAQGSTAVLIQYYAPKSEKPDKIETARDIAIVKESPAGLTLKARDEEVLLPALDVRVVRYQPTAAGVAYGDISNAFSPIELAKKAEKKEEREAEFKKGLEALRGLEPKVVTQVPLHRHVNYLIADTLAELARDDSAQRPEAIKALQKFAEDHPNGWQIAPALLTLARLQQEAGDDEGILKTYQQLAKVEGLPDELKWDAQFKQARLLLSKDNVSDARAVLSALDQELPVNNPEKKRVKLYLAQGELAQAKGDAAQKALKDVQEAIEGTREEGLKALGHNILGDHYLKVKKDEEAFWHFLRVHVLFSESTEEHAKALYHLADLFQKVKQDPNRSEECKELLKEERFEGSVYRKMVEEKK